jgi:hypothetical protein
MTNENFMGLGGFLYFFGVVEDRQDPLKTGRLRVRILGHHTENKNTLPTSDLPWALPVLPITAAGMSGIGSSATGLLEGSWVFGFFRDGTYRQEPIILGSLPGRPVSYGRPDKGFADSNIRPNKTLKDGEIIDKENENDLDVSVYPRNINEPDVNRLAVNETLKPHPSLYQRFLDKTTFVPTADFNSMPLPGNQESTLASDGTTWNQPDNPYAAVYPYNHVYESESGHISEFDDTKDSERIHLRHRTGTGYEMHPNGDQTTLTRNHTEINKGTVNHYITGNNNTTIDGHSKIFINKSGGLNNHYDIQIGSGANINIQVESGDINLYTLTGRINVNSGGDYNLKVGGDMTVEVAGNMVSNVEGVSNLNTVGEVTIRGATIDLNP